MGAVDKTLAEERECTKLTGEGGGARAGDVGNSRREIRKREIREMILCVVVDVIVVDGRWREATEVDEVGQVEQEILRQPLHGLVHTKRQGVEDGDRGHVQRNWHRQPLHGSVRHDHHCSQVSDTSTGFSLIVDKTSAKAFLRPAAASAAPSLERPPNSGARPVTSQNNDTSRKGWKFNGFFLNWTPLDRAFFSG